ncbi:hypothetical protein ACFX2G_028644 [Malus domestica]
MKFGGGFIPQDGDLRFKDPWVPVTPDKLIWAKPRPIPVDPCRNLLQGANWQQQLTGVSREHVQVGASYNGMNQAVSPHGQLLRNGGLYNSDGSLAEKSQMINHFADSYNASSFTQLLRGDSSCWNNYPMTQLLHNKAAYIPSANMNLSRSVDIAANTPLIPMLHRQLGNQENNTRSYLLTNQNCRSLVMDFPSQVDDSQRDSNSFHWLFGNQNHRSSPSSNLFSNDDSSSQISQHGFQPSYDLNSLPSTEVDTASGVIGQLQFTTDEAKNLENNQLSAMLKSLTDKCDRKEKGKQVIFIEDEANQTNGDELLQNIVKSSSAAISKPYNKNKESDSGGDRGIDLNKTPQQKPPKRRKHRPKVIIEGKAKRTPKPATPKNTKSKETRPAKRKFERMNVQKESPSQLADITLETADANAGKGAKSRRRVLHFDLEKTMDENLCRAIGQQEETQQVNKRTFDLNFDSQGTHMGTETNQVNAKPAEQSGLLNELLVDKQIPGTLSNPIHSMSLMPNNFTFLPERQVYAALLATTKDISHMHLKNSHVMRRLVENADSDLCQKRCRDESTPMQQHSHAGEICQDVIRANINHENLQKTKELVNQGDSLLKLLSLPSEGRESKKEFFRTAEHTRLSTNNPPSSPTFQEILQLDEIQKNSGILSNDFSGNGFASKNHKILSSYIENNKIMDRENKEISKFTGDRKSRQIANKQVSHDNTSAKKQSEGITLSKVSSGTDKVCQEKDSAYDHKQPSAKAIGYPIRTRCTIPIDDIIHQFNGLNLNGSCSEILEQEKTALVPYKGDGVIVPFQGIIKKHKPRPKVELDPETYRIWNLLMGKEGSEGNEGTDKNEKYWEEERNVFQGRVDSFIARMHLVQGKIHFIAIYSTTCISSSGTKMQIIQLEVNTKDVNLTMKTQT